MRRTRSRRRTGLGYLEKCDTGGLHTDVQAGPSGPAQVEYILKYLASA